MGNSLIIPLYKKVFEEDFDYGDFGKRMKMQKCIYLIEQLGINVGEYAFSWYKHGPYSQRLQDDMFAENGRGTQELIYSDYALNVINRLKSIIRQASVTGFSYSIEQWMECLASVHYLNRMFNGDKQKTLEELVRRKAHLNDNGLNNHAYELIVSMV